MKFSKIIQIIRKNKTCRRFWSRDQGQVILSSLESSKDKNYFGS